MKALRTFAAVALIGLTTLTAHAQSGRYQDRFDRQDEKNASRTIGIGLGALALDRLANGKVGDALLLGVGAAAAGKHFEDIRKEQNCDRDRDRYDDRRGDRYRYERERLERERARREWERRERQERIERERREQERREWERRRRQDRYDDRSDRWDDRRDRWDDRRDRDDDHCRDHR